MWIHFPHRCDFTVLHAAYYDDGGVDDVACAGCAPEKDLYSHTVGVYWVKNVKQRSEIVGVPATTHNTPNKKNKTHTHTRQFQHAGNNVLVYTCERHFYLNIYIVHLFYDARCGRHACIRSGRHTRRTHIACAHPKPLRLALSALSACHSCCWRMCVRVWLWLLVEIHRYVCVCVRAQCVLAECARCDALR